MGKSLTLRETAQLLRVHQKTIRRRVLSGELPHFRVVGRIRIRVEDLSAYLVREQSPAQRSEARAGGAVLTKAEELW